MEIQKPSQEEELSWGQLKTERLRRCAKASMEFDESRVFVRVVCSKEAAETFGQLGVFINKLLAEMTQNPGSYDHARPELFRNMLLVQMEIRKELEVDVT